MVSEIEFEELKQEHKELKDRQLKLEQTFNEFIETILKSYGASSDKPLVQTQSGK